VTSSDEAKEGLPRPVLPALHGILGRKLIIDLMVQGGRRDIAVMSKIPARRQFENMVRLMDKTVDEYRCARDRCDGFVRWLDGGGNDWLGLYRAIDHMENCISALHRTLLHLEQIRTSSAGPPVDRWAYKALRAGKDKINDARDWMEHADEKLSKLDESLGRSGVPPVFLKAERVTVGPHSVAYSDLAQWIHQTFRLVDTLFEKTPRS
jgi:hypothetical protein